MRSYGLDLVRVTEKIPISDVPVEITPATEGDAIGGFNDQQFLLSATQYLAAEILADARLRHQIRAFRCCIGTLSIDHGEMPSEQTLENDPTAILLVKHSNHLMITIPLRTDGSHDLDTQAACGWFAAALQGGVYTRTEMISMASKLLRCANVVGARYVAWRAARLQTRTLFHDLRNCLTTTLAEVALLKRVAETHRGEYEQAVAAHLQTAAHLLGNLEQVLAKPPHHQPHQPKQTTSPQRGATAHAAKPQPPQPSTSAAHPTPQEITATYVTEPVAQEEAPNTTKVYTYRATELVCRAACWAVAAAENYRQGEADRLKVRTATKGYEQLTLALEPAQVDCIIQNIVKNGVEAACANTAPGQTLLLEIIIENSGLRCSFIVRDSGPGFSPQYLDAQKSNALGTTPYSTKRNSHSDPAEIEKRGYGLLSIRQILQRVDGHLNYRRGFSALYDVELSEVEVSIPQAQSHNSLVSCAAHRLHTKKELTASEGGFSLVELLVVLAILAALVTIGITYVRASRSAANMRAAAEVLRNAILMRAQDAKRLRAGAPPDAFNPLGSTRLELRVDQPQTWGPITQATLQGASWNYTASPTAAVILPSGWLGGNLNCLPAISAVGPPPVANPTAANRIVFDSQGNLYDPNQPDSANNTVVTYICVGQSSAIAATAPQGANAQALQLWYADTSTWSALK